MVLKASVVLWALAVCTPEQMMCFNIKINIKTADYRLLKVLFNILKWIVPDLDANQSIQNSSHANVHNIKRYDAKHLFV